MPDFKPQEHTTLGFTVSDVAGTVRALKEKGIALNVYQALARMISEWTSPGGAVHVAWFNDPDGNVLSVSDVS